MKFDKGIAKKYKQSVNDAFDTILNVGNLDQKMIAQNILDSEMLIRVGPVSRVKASGITGVIDPFRTNKLIRKGGMSIGEAFGQIYIAMAEETIDLGGQRGCEGTLVHEGRHAYDFATAIASFSDADVNPLSIFNPSLYELEWEAHKTSGNYMILMDKPEYLQEGLDLMILGILNGKHYVNEKGIKKRLQDSYGLNENNTPGVTADRLLGLDINI